MGNTKRINQLVKLEMAYDGSSYMGKHNYNEDFNVHHTEIVCDTDEQWDTKIDKLTVELKRRQDETENTNT